MHPIDSELSNLDLDFTLAKPASPYLFPCLVTQSDTSSHPHITSHLNGHYHVAEQDDDDYDEDDEDEDDDEDDESKSSSNDSDHADQQNHQKLSPSISNGYQKMQLNCDVNLICENNKHIGPQSSRCELADVTINANQIENKLGSHPDLHPNSKSSTSPNSPPLKSSVTDEFAQKDHANSHESENHESDDEEESSDDDDEDEDDDDDNEDDDEDEDDQGEDDEEDDADDDDDDDDEDDDDDDDDESSEDDEREVHDGSLSYHSRLRATPNNIDHQLYTHHSFHQPELRLQPNHQMCTTMTHDVHHSSHLTDISSHHNFNNGIHPQEQLHNHSLDSPLVNEDFNNPTSITTSTTSASCNNYHHVLQNHDSNHYNLDMRSHEDGQSAIDNSAANVSSDMVDGERMLEVTRKLVRSTERDPDRDLRKQVLLKTAIKKLPRYMDYNGHFDQFDQSYHSSNISVQAYYESHESQQKPPTSFYHHHHPYHLSVQPNAILMSTTSLRMLDLNDDQDLEIGNNNDNAIPESIDTPITNVDPSATSPTSPMLDTSLNSSEDYYSPNNNNDIICNNNDNEIIDDGNNGLHESHTMLQLENNNSINNNHNDDNEEAHQTSIDSGVELFSPCRSNKRGSSWIGYDDDMDVDTLTDISASTRSTSSSSPNQFKKLRKREIID